MQPSTQFHKNDEADQSYSSQQQQQQQQQHLPPLPPYPPPPPPGNISTLSSSLAVASTDRRVHNYLHSSFNSKHSVDGESTTTSSSSNHSVVAAMAQVQAASAAKSAAPRVWDHKGREASFSPEGSGGAATASNDRVQLRRIQQRTSQFHAYVAGLFHKNDGDAQDPATVSELKQKRRRNFCLDFLVYPTLAGLLMHGPGLKVKWEYEEWPEYLESLTGAAVEGAFLLLLAMRFFHAGHCVYGYVAGVDSKILPKVFVLAGAALACWYFGFILSAILGDATFRMMSGNDSPAEEVIKAGFDDAHAHVVSQFQSDPFGSLWRLVFASACIGGSVALYHVAAVRKWYTKRREKKRGGGGEKGQGLVMGGSAAQVNLAPGAAAAEADGDEESNRVGAVGSGKANRCSLPNSDKHGLPKSRVLQVYIMGVLLGTVACYLNAIDGYTPVIFAYFSVYFGEEGVMSGHTLHKARASAAVGTRGVASSAEMPNVIYIQHESMSGAIMLNTAEGEKAMPWFTHVKKENPDFYVFEHGRTVSGITIDAMPALMTGCAPYTMEAADWVHAPGRPIGYDFYQRGYNTASYSSRALDKTIRTGQWSMLYDPLTGGMEQVVDPLGHGWKYDNSEGSADRRMLPEFEKWLSYNATKNGAPFYAQLYNFNQHYPYMREVGNPKFKHRYFDSLRSTDNFLKHLFEILEKTGQLENTIVVGSGDHGEDPFKASYVRLSALNSNVLHTSHYIYYPKHLMPDPSKADRLRRNTQMITHTLDMYPTVQSILNGGYYDNLQHAHPECITGIDLTSVDIPDDRVVISWNLVSSEIVRVKPAKFWALSTRDAEGNEWSLYHRLAKSKHPKLQQGKDNFYILHYGECTRSTAKANLCMSGVSDEYKALFRRSVEWIKHTPLLGRGVGSSKLVEFFGEKVGWEETGEYDVAIADGAVPGAMDASPEGLETVATADDAPPSDGADRGGPASTGFFASIAQSFQEMMGTRSNDPACDDVLLFMPNIYAPIGSQMAGYVRAAMMATFANKALVVLDKPRELTCKAGNKATPFGLSDVVESPEWLTRGCAVPCAATHGYERWNEVRQSLHQNGDASAEPVEHVCPNDNGRESRVFPIGGDEVHAFFEANFKERMLQRPSPFAYDWALRVGATEQEAGIFAQLEGEAMWDFLGALLVRNDDVLRLRKDIANEAEKLVKKANLGKSYDSIEIRRGNEVLSDPEAQSFIVNYWDARGDGTSAKDYIPLRHYLRHYYEERNCEHYRKTAYIATNDPVAVTREMNGLGKKKGHGLVRVTADKCLVFTFIVGAARNRDIKSKITCADRYSDVVADIAAFTIMRDSKTFVGEFHSDLGRLVRTSRLTLDEKVINKYEGGGSSGSLVLLKDTRIAWGYVHPGPP